MKIRSIRAAPPIVNAVDVKKLLRTDKIFSLIHKKYGTPSNLSRPPGFISLARIILEQHVSLMSANAHFLKLNSYLKEFTPAEILKLTDTELRNCQVSRQKTKYLRALSSAIVNGNLDLESLGQLDEQEMRKQLTAIKGIGNWTADIYLMFCLQAKDILPMGDVAIINTVKELSEAETKDEIIQLSDQWQSLRSLAAHFLWHYYLKTRGRYPV